MLGLSNTLWSKLGVCVGLMRYATSPLCLQLFLTQYPLEFDHMIKVVNIRASALGGGNAWTKEKEF